jgi:pSer/pThr/pTyr-binding forkhead associated (FHA) protein
VSEVICNRCRTPNGGNANFCSACGAPLLVHAADSTIVLPADSNAVEPEGDLTVEVSPSRVGIGMLVVRSGPDTGQVYELVNTVTTIGRSPDNDVFLDDVTVSRRHAVVIVGSDRFTVRDAGSLNGTYRNRERIAEAELHAGDEVQIGKFRLVFLLGGAE